MNKKPYGPVPVSRIKPEAKTIFEALAAGRPVHISRHGQVVAVIDPPATIPQEMLAAYALGDHVGLSELTATDINQGAPTSAILAVAAQGPRYVTRERRVRGLLRRVTESDLAASEPSDEQLAERERRLAEYLKAHPNTDIAALADYGDQVDQELGISPGEMDVRPQDLLGLERSQRLREYIKEASRRFAATAGDLVGTSPHVLSGRDEIVSEFESRTTEAIAEVAGAVLDGVAQRTKFHEVEAIRLQGIEHRAELALGRLESGTLAEEEGEVGQTANIEAPTGLAGQRPKPSTMGVNAFIVYAGVYDSLSDAEADYALVQDLHTKAGRLDSYDAAVIARRADGKTKIIQKHETTTRVGGGLGDGVGLATGLVMALFPFAAIGGGLLAVTTGGGAVLGALAGHAAAGMSRHDLKELGEHLDGGQAGLVVVGVADMGAKIERAMKKARRIEAKALKADTADIEADAASAQA